MFTRSCARLRRPDGLGEHLPGGRRQLYLMSDDNNGATQITRFYSLAVDLH